MEDTRHARARSSRLPHRLSGLAQLADQAESADRRGAGCGHAPPARSPGGSSSRRAGSANSAGVPPILAGVSRRHGCARRLTSHSYVTLTRECLVSKRSKSAQSKLRRRDGSTADSGCLDLHRLRPLPLREARRQPKRLSCRLFPRSPAARVAKSVRRAGWPACARPRSDAGSQLARGGLFFTYPSPSPRKETALGAGQLELLSTSCIWQQFAPDGLSSGEHRCSRPAQVKSQAGGSYPPKGRAAGGLRLMPRQAVRFEKSRVRRAHRLTTFMSQLDSFCV